MKKVLVVGSTSGIGKELKNLLEDCSYEVVSFSRQSGVDITDEKPLFPLIDGFLDAIVYCPGTINLKPFASLTIEDFQKDFAVNFLGAVKVIQHYLKQLTEGASIVLFSSVAVRKGFIYHSSIASAKGAIEGFVKSFAQEMAPKIRINAIAPSLTETPLSTFLTSDLKKREVSIKKHPLGRLGTPQDMAYIAEYLVSDKSSFITGQVIGVDGGI